MSAPMAGRLIAVVGPSGVGKDSVMHAIALRRPEIHLAQRVITRPRSAGGEDFIGATLEEFERRESTGNFALSWGAHGLFYGVPKSQLAPMRMGRDVMVNLSRGVLLAAADLGMPFLVLSLSAPDEVLAARLLGRGRETKEDVARRLARAKAPLPAGLDVVNVANDHTLAACVDQVERALYPIKS